MNRKRFTKCRLPRRCGAVLLAAALSLSVLGTGSAFADTTENGDEIVEMTVSGDYEASVYEASIEEAGGYVYYAFTPEESGTYSFYTTGDYDTYAYIYDADWNELDSDDDSGSNTNAKIKISLEAGNTYYIAFRFYSSDTTGSFNVYAEKVNAVVSAELVLSKELVLYEGLDSCEKYDDNGEAFEYYDCDELDFTRGDQIVLTLEDGSTVTYTSSGSLYFYDENGERLSFDCSSDQYSEHWEAGNTYYFTYTLTDYAIDVQIPVTIVALDPVTFTELVTGTEYTVSFYYEPDGYVYYAFTPEESGTYRFYTTGDYDTYAYIYDADWNELDSDDDSGSDGNANIAISLEAGNTYYIVFRFSSETMGSFSVYAEKVNVAVSAELVLSQELVRYKGLDSCEEYDDDNEVYDYYYIDYGLNFTSGDQIVLTLEDGSTVTCTSDGSFYFYDEDDERLSYSCSSDQSSEHWEVGNTYYFTYTLTEYVIDLQIPVTIAVPDPAAFTELVTDTEYTVRIGKEIDYVCYAFTPEESGTYSFYTTGDYDTDAYIYDADGYVLDEDCDNDSRNNAKITILLEEGNTYYLVFWYFTPDTTGSFSVYAEKVIAAVSAELVLSQELVLYEGLDSSEKYDDNDKAFEYYDCDELDFTSGDQIVLALEDGSTVTYMADGYGNFIDEDGNYLEFDVSSDQYDEHWEVGNTYYFTYTLTDYAIDVQIPVTIAALDPETFTELTAGTESTAVIEEAGGYVYYAFTPEEKGTYSFYTTGDYDTYAYIYDADWNLLASDDDSGSNTNAKIMISLKAGYTYYIAFRFNSSDTTGSFGVYLEMTGSKKSDDDSSGADDSGTSGDDSSGADDSGTSGDDSNGEDDSDTAGDGSTSDDDGSNGGNSDDGNSSGEQNSGQTVGGSTNLKTQKITVKKAQLKKTIKYKKLKKKARTFKLKASTSGNGKITYKKVSGNKKIKVSKTGKVTVKKGLKKGKTYKVKVKITAAKTSTCKKASVTKTIKIKIK